ncbi:hypothetical protein ES288_D10G090200v1 [Gossypium darwinii]|uniref:Uncharacterized protein n=1 Tax=Gossypium darwinii TaxID=34276 RepID=A0A5D2B1C2_GOSDA|nr:hypothetical protein ES288_D10G090200v1 [Gossypium darwinii]
MLSGGLSWKLDYKDSRRICDRKCALCLSSFWATFPPQVQWLLLKGRESWEGQNVTRYGLLCFIEESNTGLVSLLCTEAWRSAPARLDMLRSQLEGAFWI